MESSLVDTLLGWAIFAVLVWAGIRAVRYARTHRKGAHALGAALIILGLGTVKDPNKQTMHQAQAPKPKKGEESEDDPPDDNEVR